MDKSMELIELTRRMLDLKKIKKDACKEWNEQIKEIEAEIKKLVKE